MNDKQIGADNQAQINLANFSVTMTKSNPQHQNGPPKRPPPPKIGFLRRPIPIAPVDDDNKLSSIYTISPARQSIADFNLTLKKPEPIFVSKQRNSTIERQIWLRRSLIAGGTLLILCLALFVIFEFTKRKQN